MFLRKIIQNNGRFLREGNKQFCYLWNKLKNVDNSDKISKNVSNKFNYVNMKYGNDARKMLVDGIIEMSETVAKTYGPLGKNVAISENRSPVIVTKDGVTVAKYISFSSKKKNLGCRLLSSISGSTNIHAGDGTTTSTILGAEIMRRGTFMIDIGFHPLEVKKGIDVASKCLIQYLEQIRTFLNSKKNLYDLAMITTNNNEEISEIVSQAVFESGTNIMVNIEESKIGVNELKIEEGMFVNNGYATADYVISSSDETIDLENPLILVVRSPIKEISDIIKTLEYIKSIERPLIIFSPEIKKEPLSVLVYNSRLENLKVIAVNIPDYINDDSNIEILRDICAMTGAQMCDIQDLNDNELASNLLYEDHFGAVKKCKVSQFQTILMGVMGDRNSIKNMISEIKLNIKNETNPGYKSYYQERLTRLQGKSVTINVGGITPVEVSENRDKFVDALNSCKTALEHGVLPGGGASFVHGLKILEKLKLQNNDLNVGVNIFYNAVQDTVKHLYKNSPLLPDFIIEKIQLSDNHFFGYNLSKQTFSNDLVKEGIVDSFNTIKTAIDDAVSVGSLLITTECVVFKEVDYEPPPLDAFRNRIKTDPEYREKIKREFYSDNPEIEEDFKVFSSVI